MVLLQAQMVFQISVDSMSENFQSLIHTKRFTYLLPRSSQSRNEILQRKRYVLLCLYRAMRNEPQLVRDYRNDTTNRRALRGIFSRIRVSYMCYPDMPHTNYPPIPTRSPPYRKHHAD